MSYAATNGTNPLSHVWSGYLAQAQQVPSSRWLILALVNTPVFVILFNALWQKIAPRKASDPPVVFHWLPIVGSAIWYGNDPIGFFTTCQEKYGNVFTFILLGRKVTVALSSKGSNFVLGGKSTAFNAEGAYKHLTTPVFGKDVVYDCPNDVFMQQKKFVKFGLTTENFRAYIGMIEDEVDEFMKRDARFKTYQQNDINEWGSFDAIAAMAEITILTASRTLQGKEVREGLNNYRKRDRAQKKMSDFYVDIISRRKANPDGDHHYDMIASLSDQNTPAPHARLDDAHLASRPDVAAALYDEQVKRFANPDGTLRPMSYEDLRHLPVLDSCIRETLRVHPPIHSIMRQVREDVPVPPTLAAPSKDGVYVVPKDTYVLASPLISQIDPRIWKDGAEWQPSRWNDADGVAAQALDAYTDEGGEKIDFGFGAVSKGTDSPYQPFGAGKHRCIGEQFAYLQIGTIIATIIRKVELKLPTPVPEHNYHTLILMPKDPKSVYYRRRKFD
ncbi:cytochrome P450 [Mycena galopus ATCC 62051]|nr:cytochrome P450 [Mycena galopus ATCC 62051]